jgi:hypothetical protein
MSKLKEYKRLSMEFRRVSSNLLRSEYSDENLYVIRFKEYIDNSTVIKDMISKSICDSDYSFEDCFYKVDTQGWQEIKPPTKESDHIKAMYDYIDYIVSNSISIESLAMNLYHGSSKRTEIIRAFIDRAFLPLINFITDSLSTQIMLLEEVNKVSVSQHIEKNYGTANAAHSNIESINIINNPDIDDILKLIVEIKALIPENQMDDELTENLSDDLDIVEEQIQSEKPRKARLKKAYKGVMSFLAKSKDAALLGTKLFVVLPAFIEKLHEFIEKLPN